MKNVTYTRPFCTKLCPQRLDPRAACDLYKALDDADRCMDYLRGGFLLDGWRYLCRWFTQQPSRLGYVCTVVLAGGLLVGGGALVMQKTSEALLMGGIATAACFLLILLWWLPKWQTAGIELQKDRLPLETEARETLARLLGGISARWLVFYMGYLQETREQVRVSRDGLRVSREEQ